MSSESFATPIVSTAWLADHLSDPGVTVLDASLYLPSAKRDPLAEYRAGHIPGAQFADIAWLSDETASLPHTVPSAAQFGERVGALGISADSTVVVYDSSGQNFSAPRVWWLFRLFGHTRVAVLDGGLKKWTAEGRAIETAVPTPTPVAYAATLDATRLRAITQMRHNVDTAAEQVVDARSAGRFEASAPEPRAGVRGGHVPGSVNLHYASLVSDDGTLRSDEELRALVGAVGLDLGKPIVATCGSGVTACAVVLALDKLGAERTAVYDGSWTEWGSATDTPVETGAAR